MPAPLVTFHNETDLTIEWGHDFHVGGPIGGYEIKMAREELQEPHMIYVSPTSRYQMDWTLNKMDDSQDWAPNCLSNTTVYKYNFTIRSVVVDPATDIEYRSPWSPVETVPGYCSSKYLVFF